MKLEIKNSGSGVKVTLDTNVRVVCNNGLAENNRKMADACTLSQADTQPGPLSMYVMGMLSDVQDSIRFGNPKLAIAICNDIKLIIDQRMSTKDEHGRHDYTPAERTRKGF